MKLRIKGSSIRLRLTQGELRSLAETGAVEESVSFGAHSALVYCLSRDNRFDYISANYKDNRVEIRVPGSHLERWCATDLVTLAASQPVPGGELKIILEKDFACLVPREGEDESDHFPHPKGPDGGCP